MNKIVNKKDYWNLSKRNFIGLTLLWIIVSIIFFTNNIASGIIALSVALVHFIIARMFSKRINLAYIITYILYGIALLLNTVGHFLSSGKINIIGVLITIYILYYARKAQTQVN